MPTSVRAGSRTTFTPGVYITRDDSALQRPSLGASGVVALVGTATGGKPYTAFTGARDIVQYTSPGALLRDYPAGDLPLAANLALNAAPSGGAQAIIPIKVNPATQASLRLNGAQGASVVFTAAAYGAAGNQIAVQVVPGSSRGVGLSIRSGDALEQADNLAGAPVGTLAYAGGTDAPGSVKATFAGGTLEVDGSLTTFGRASELTQSQLVTPAPISVNAAASDAGASLTVYGTDANGAALVETLTLAEGANPTQNTYAHLLGAVLSQPAFQVTLLDGSGATLAALAHNAERVGVATCFGAFAAGLPASLSGPQGATVLTWGQGADGNAHAEAVVLGAQATSTQTAFARVDGFALGGVPATASVTCALTVCRIGVGPSLTLEGLAAQVATLLDTRGSAPAGLTLAVASGEGGTLVGSLDTFSGVDLRAAAGAALSSDLEALVDWVNTNSALVTAAAPTGAVGLPEAMASPLNLQGGAENAAQASDWAAALDLLKKVRVNLVVCLTCDPAVTALATAHCNYMSGIGESERFCHAGLQNAAQTAPAARTEIFSQQAAVNAAYTYLFPNGVYGPDLLGNQIALQPHFTAAVWAGLRGGLPIGEPMTRKPANVTGEFHDPSWDPIDDSDAMLAQGICILRDYDGPGTALVRDLTSWTRDDDPAKSSGAIAYSCAYAAYNFRLALQAYIGRSGFSGGVNQIITGATQLLAQLKSAQAIYDYDPPTGEESGDTVTLDVTIYAVPEVNFILPTLHISLPDLTVAAAA